MRTSILTGTSSSISRAAIESNFPFAFSASACCGMGSAKFSTSPTRKDGSMICTNHMVAPNLSANGTAYFNALSEASEKSIGTTIRFSVGDEMDWSTKLGFRTGFERLVARCVLRSSLERLVSSFVFISSAIHLSLIH
jgi:hypothetical protein